MEQESSPQPGRFERARALGSWVLFTLCASGIGAASMNLIEQNRPNSGLAIGIVSLGAIGFTVCAVSEWRAYQDLRELAALEAHSEDTYDA